MADLAGAAEPAGLELQDLSKTFETAGGAVPVLRNVDLRLAGGTAAAIVGPSGSGKSTLLHVVGTLEPPSSGRVVIDGVEPFRLPEAELARFRNRSIGFVFQDHHLLPQYSVLENVLLPTFAVPGGDRAAALERAHALIARVGLGHRLGHRPAELSGGERQRTAIARALIQLPKVLLCDEPTGNLDAAAAAAVVELLFELHHQEGHLLLVVTHDLGLAARLPRRFTIEDGACVET